MGATDYAAQITMIIVPGSKVVNVYDSAYSSTCYRLFRSSSCNIMIVDVQKQKAVMLFAIANATTIAFKRSQSKCNRLIINRNL